MRVLLAAFLLLAVLAPRGVAAQTQTVLFPGQTGTELLASLRAAYAPTSITGTNDELYSVIERTTVGGQQGVVCVYTGFFVPFDCNPSCDPSQDVFNNGAGINQEHTWPQSLLPSGLPRADLHNLFPTQVQANSDRGNLRFAEIPDPQTTRWYRGGPPYSQTSIPTANIDEYSELRSGVSFEPREDHKGDVARALFYMRTVYTTSTNATFPFDAADRRTLYDWHRADPITAANQTRSTRVAAYQGGRDNPYVLDSTLVRRAFFPEIIVSDEPGAPLAAGPRLRAEGAQPFAAEARLTVDLPSPAVVRVDAFDALGRRIGVLFDGAAPAGALALRLDGRALAPGVYVVRASVSGESAAAVLTQRLVRAR